MRARDRAIVMGAWAATGLLVLGLGAVIVDLLARGGGVISKGFLLDLPSRAGLEGGIASIIASTAWIVLVAIAAAVPVGVATAVALADAAATRPRLGRVVQKSLDVLAGVPSIVFGLFGMKLFCEELRLGWSILAGGLTLSWMILPLVVRATEEGLRAVHADHRLACRALGVSRLGALLHVELPTAAPLVAAGLVLSIGRALAESAAVLFTAGAALRMPSSFLDPGRTLAVHIYTLSIEVPGGEARAAATGLVLVLFITVATLAADRLVRRLARAAGVAP